MLDYAFGAGDFKLGDRVEILTTGQRGVLIEETIHISGCNTYRVLLPNVETLGRVRTTSRDHLMLRKLNPDESIFALEKVLTDENSFTPKGIDVNAEWIRSAISEDKEFVTEIDDAVGVAEIALKPGMEVWNKVYGKTTIVVWVTREIYSKELVYGTLHMVDDYEVVTYSHAYALVPLEQKVTVPKAEKHGSMFDDGRYGMSIRDRYTNDMFYSAVEGVLCL